MKSLGFDAASSPSVASPRHVLVVESDPDQRRRVLTQLVNWGYTPLAASSAEDALALLGRTRVAFSLIAIRLPGLSGIELVRRAPELSEAGPVIMIADAGHSAQIVEAIQAGADDFIRRPYTAEDLENAIRAVAARPRREPASPVSEENGERLQRELALLVSPQMREIQQVIEQAARADVTVLVCGETGVGKELVARAIHRHSVGRRGAFIKVNCAAMPRELLESELFGHERGAFTGAHQRKPGRFELADGGTIFLDEIGELHPALQAKLLHVLQDGEFSRVGGRHNIRVDVRTICATNRDLAGEVASGRFREDLFYRLNVINILVPPLRERREEIPGLVEYFVQRYARVFNVAERSLSPEVMQAFLTYHWPGNIRELENFIKRMIVLQDWTLARTLVAPVVAPAPPAAPAVRGHQGAVAQGDLSPRGARGRARGHRAGARAVPVEPGEDRQDAEDQLPRAPLQDEGHGPHADADAAAGAGRGRLRRIDNMAVKWFVVSLTVLIALVSAAAAEQQQQQQTSSARPGTVVPAAPVTLASDYIIGPEDMLQISVWKNETLSRELPVRPDGKVSMPLLHDIQAAGLTPMQLRDKIATALAEFMPSPEVSVTVLEVRSYRVSVLGEVQRPGVLQLRAPTTVLEALALAGGFRDFASPSKIVIFRKDQRGQTERLRFNYNRAVGSAADENLTLRSGDVVVVP